MVIRIGDKAIIAIGFLVLMALLIGCIVCMIWDIKSMLKISGHLRDKVFVCILGTFAITLDLANLLILLHKLINLNA